LILGPAVADSLRCRALEDGLLYVFCLVTAAGSLVASIYAVPRIARFFDDRASVSRKQTPFSRGVKR
jgi:hypothetical protein